MPRRYRYDPYEEYRRLRAYIERMYRNYHRMTLRGANLYATDYRRADRTLERANHYLNLIHAAQRRANDLRWYTARIQNNSNE